ncbi:MAG: hypothetical protein GYA46_08285 [candidate division Zixibacteria bacterium]|nr:hypothetical protein [candidate division Zixibacteria bacterium]
MRRLCALSSLSIALFLLAGTAVAADNGGRVRVGYVVLDEEGNLAVNQETFNTYEGPSLSLDKFRYLTGGGLNLFADLQNITLNNRHLRAGISKPGRFGVSLYHNQYRRTYSFDGGTFTRRSVAGGQFECMPLKYFHFFGGFDLARKHGGWVLPYEFRGDTTVVGTDYTQSSISIGAQTFLAGGTLRLEYRTFNFSDELYTDGDRDARQFSVTAFLPIPRYHRVTISGGYHYRRNRHDWTETELVTRTGWGGVRAMLPLGWSLDGRFLFARNKHSVGYAETDNVVTTLAAARSWPRWGGVRVGYENRIADDLIDRTVANILMAAGWVKPDPRISLRGRWSTRLKEVKTGATLLGDEDVTRYQFGVRFQDTLHGDLSLQYQGRVRTNDDLDTRVEYTAVTAAVTVDRLRYGTAMVTYSYYLGTFENRAAVAPDNYEFSDHVITGSLRTMSWRHIRGNLGGTYYRSRRDRDVEKFGLSIGAEYDLRPDLTLDATYRAVNYDDFLVNDRYYTGNIVTVNITKGFRL